MDVVRPSLHGAALARPSLEDQWRAINLFGRNVASYKFALAEALLTLRPQGGDLLRLEEIAGPFARAVSRHLKSEPKQSTSAKSQYLAECQRYNAGELSSDQLIDATVARGFNNVIDAFHVVGQKNIPDRFFLDERQGSGGLRITDAFSRLVDARGAEDLPSEGEARWRLVETAWRLGIGRAMVAAYDTDGGTILLPDRSMRRIAVTSCRHALNGYQQGKCFYCSTLISVTSGVDLADVDHFYPHTLKGAGLGEAANGVWNLVLACRACNRGVKGKSDRVPAADLVRRLHTRNEFLIRSHHPLRETLIAQTGRTETARRSYIESVDALAISKLIHRWAPTQ